VTFTVTPSAVSNTYNGQITLHVTGLASGGTVVVQKFLDLNTNGVIDAHDLLVQQFSMTDGKTGMAIAGVTNFNVPGDTDTTAGQITAKLNFNSGDFLQTIAGRYLFKLSGTFTPPITNVFTVTNFPWPQTITGNVVSNGSSFTLSNAFVVLMPGPDASPIAGVVASKSGAYSIPVPPGTYSLAAFRTNYLCNFSTLPTVLVSSGATVTTNLTLTVATTNISGRLVDATNSSLGLPGILVTARSASGSRGFAVTDTNGNFNLRVQSGQWTTKADAAALIVHGYLRLENGTNVAPGPTAITIAVPRATGLIYGSVKDNLGNPLAGIDVYADDSSQHLYETDGYTGTNGNYCLAALRSGTNDSWELQAIGPSSYIFSQPQWDGTLTNNTAVEQDFTALLATNHISGMVTCGGTNIAGVGLTASATIGGAYYSQSVDTDAHGSFWFNVANSNQWAVELNLSHGSDSLDTILGAGNYVLPDTQLVALTNHDSVNNFAVQPCSGIQILTTNLPAGEVGVHYDQFIGAWSCRSGLAWSVLSGSLPQGLVANTGSGELSGTPTNAGVFNFAIQVSNAANESTNHAFSVAIVSALQVATASLPNGTNGTAYSQQLDLAGGLPPFQWSLSPGSSNLPPNLILATNGLLSGTLAGIGTFNFRVRVTDSAAAIADQPLSLKLTQPALQITTTVLPDATQGTFYSTALGALGGQPPYVWSLVPGSASLPPNLTLGTNGVLAGTPASSGTNWFIVRVTDAAASTVNRVFSLVATPPTTKPVVSITGVRWLTNRELQFTFNTSVNTSYTIQASTNLANWDSLLTLAGSGAPMTIIDPGAAGSTRRFYRVKVGP